MLPEKNILRDVGSTWFHKESGPAWPRWARDLWVPQIWLMTDILSQSKIGYVCIYIYIICIYLRFYVFLCWFLSFIYFCYFFPYLFICLFTCIRYIYIYIDRYIYIYIYMYMWKYYCATVSSSETWIWYVSNVFHVVSPFSDCETFLKANGQ